MPRYQAWECLNECVMPNMTMSDRLIACFKACECLRRVTDSQQNQHCFISVVSYVAYSQVSKVLLKKLLLTNVRWRLELCQ